LLVDFLFVSDKPIIIYLLSTAVLSVFSELQYCSTKYSPVSPVDFVNINKKIDWQNSKI